MDIKAIQAFVDTTLKDFLHHKNGDLYDSYDTMVSEGKPIQYFYHCLNSKTPGDHIAICLSFPHSSASIKPVYVTIYPEKLVEGKYVRNGFDENDPLLLRIALIVKHNKELFPNRKKEKSSGGCTLEYSSLDLKLAIHIWRALDKYYQFFKGRF